MSEATDHQPPEAEMKARRMIAEGGFSPEDIVFLTKILEDVWLEAQDGSVRNAEVATAERERLATIIISLAPHSRNEEERQFKTRVFQRFCYGI